MLWNIGWNREESKLKRELEERFSEGSTGEGHGKESRGINKVKKKKWKKYGRNETPNG